MYRVWTPGVSLLTRFSLFGIAAMMAFAPSSASAQGYSTDIELVRPTFSHKGLPGIDTPLFTAQPTMRIGLLHQYERDPLIMYQFGEELGGEGNGSVIKHRNATALGVSYDFSTAFGSWTRSAAHHLNGPACNAVRSASTCGHLDAARSDAIGIRVAAHERHLARAEACGHAHVPARNSAGAGRHTHVAAEARRTRSRLELHGTAVAASAGSGRD